MNFEKAYKELLAGKKIRRKEWDNLTHLKIVDGKVKAFRGEHTVFYQGCEILNTQKWLVVDGDGKLISFIDAIEELKLRKSIRQEEWPDDMFLFVDKDQLAICRPIEFEFMPTWRCLQSIDWEIMK